MKKLLILSLPLVMFCSKPPEQRAAETAEKISRTMCEKMHTCFEEKLAGMPEAQRKMAQGMMTIDCDKIVKESTEDFREDGDIQLTSHETELAQACMEHMSKLSCSDMQKMNESPNPCTDFEAAMEKRSKTH